jgi:hypothetical protein
MRKYLMIVLVCILIAACNSKKTENKSENSAESTSKKKQYNISVLLDLSDRVDTTLNSANPQHYVRDLEVIKSISKFFVNDMKARGVFESKGKIKVIFSPTPNDPNVNTYAQKLNVDCSILNNTQKKEIYDNMESTFNENLSKIYKQTMIDKNWCGSDIWRFFKNDIDMCIEKSENYRNILVIVTDGYIYHQNTIQNTGNRFSYISPALLDKFKLRNNSKWEMEIKNSDFGLLSSRSDLKNLEVMVLEVSAYSDKFKSDEDVIKHILARWFKEMGVNRSSIYYSDLPAYTQKRIEDFMSNN